MSLERQHVSLESVERHPVAKKNKPLMNVWEFPEKSGIKIRERLNNVKQSGSMSVSYRVSIPTKLSGKRAIELKQFKDAKEAEDWASKEFKKYRDFGKKAQELSPSQRIDAIEATKLLAGESFSLRETVSKYLELKRLVDSHELNLDHVVEFGISRLKPAGGAHTFGQVVDELVQTKENFDLAAPSIKDFSNRAEKAKAKWVNREIHQIELDEIKSWLMSLKLSPRSRKNYMMNLREIFKYAKQKGYVPDNPMDMLSVYDSKTIYGRESSDIREPNILSIDEVKRLLNTAKAHPELDLLAAVTLGLFCGIRTEELKKLTWEDVRLNEERPFVVISSRIAKKRRIRNVDIPHNAVTWLKSCIKESGPIAKNDYVSDYQKRFRNLQKLAGFGKWIEEGKKRKWRSTWKENSIRHSFGSYHYALHGDSMLTSRLMGHKEGDAVLFEYYRALVSKEKAKKYFSLKL